MKSFGATTKHAPVSGPNGSRSWNISSGARLYLATCGPRLDLAELAKSGPFCSASSLALALALASAMATIPTTFRDMEQAQFNKVMEEFKEDPKFLIAMGNAADTVCMIDGALMQCALHANKFLEYEKAFTLLDPEDLEALAELLFGDLAVAVIVPRLEEVDDLRRRRLEPVLENCGHALRRAAEVVLLRGGRLGERDGDRGAQGVGGVSVHCSSWAPTRHRDLRLRAWSGSQKVQRDSV